MKRKFTKTLFAAAVMVMLFSPAVFAAGRSSDKNSTPVPNELAKEYYNSCMAEGTAEYITQEHLEDMCACVSTQVQQTMTVEELEILHGPDPIASERIQKKIMITVYAPCMEFTMHDVVLNTCNESQMMIDATTGWGGGGTDKTNKISCKCVAKKTTEYIAKNSQEIMIEELENDPFTLNPNSLILFSDKFRTQMQNATIECVK